MALSAKKLMEVESALKEGGLMDAADTIEEHTRGDYYSVGQQVRGWYYFTKERVIFISGWGVRSFSIKYTDILELKKSFVGLFFPFGITVTANDPENGKPNKYKFSLNSRKHWIELLVTKSGAKLL